MKKLIFLPLFLIICITLQAKGSASEATRLVTLEVIPEYSSIDKETKDILLAFKFRITKDWHIYWRNPGDSGIPTEIKIDYSNVSASEIIWACPELISSSEIINYGYSDSVVLFVRVTPKSLTGNSITIKGKASWLVCKEKCIGESVEFSTTIQIGKFETNVTWINQRIQIEYSQLPNDKYSVKIDDLGLNFDFEANAVQIGNEIILTLSEPFKKQYDLAKSKVQFWANEGGLFKNVEKQVVTQNTIILTQDEYAETLPKKFRGLLIGEIGWQRQNKKGIEIEVNLQTNK